MLKSLHNRRKRYRIEQHNSTYLRILHYLLKRGEPATGTEIAEALRLSTVTVWYALRMNPVVFVIAEHATYTGKRKVALWAAWEYGSDDDDDELGAKLA